MTQEDYTNHPITPPLRLLREWVEAWYAAKVKHEELILFVATQAARWGADQELEACCEVLRQKGVPAWSMLRAARRPKPQSLKEQALSELDSLENMGACNADTIRRALEQLDD